MRVFHDFQIFATQGRGGVTRYFVELLRQWASGGEVEAEALLGCHESDEAGTLEALGVVRGWRCRTPRFRGQFWWNRRLAEAHLRRGRYAIYHPTYYRVFEHPAATRVVLTVHDLVHELFPQYMAPNDPTAALRGPALARADVILCVSENTRRDLLERYPLGDKPVIVTPLASAITPRSTHRRFAERPFLLFVGSRGNYKNFALVRALWERDEALRRETALVCLGGEIPTAEERALPGEVQFLRGDDALAAELYSSAAVLIYPSRYEGFGLPVLEAMRCGCPVITCRLGSLPEVAGEAAAYCSAEDPEELAQRVAAILHSTERRADLVQRGHARAAQFSWASTAAATYRAYQQAVA